MDYPSHFIGIQEQNRFTLLDLDLWSNSVVRRLEEGEIDVQDSTSTMVGLVQ